MPTLHIGDPVMDMELDLSNDFGDCLGISTKNTKKRRKRATKSNVVLTDGNRDEKHPFLTAIGKS